MILTNKGRVLQAKVEAGETLSLTKLKLGSGIIGEGQSLETLTDLVSPEQNLGIAEKTALENGLTEIKATITNAGLEEGYYVRELGVFAQDPDEGEILYAVTTDTAPDYLPAQGSATVLSQEFAIYIATSNVNHIEATIDPTALATVGFVNLTIDAHNTSDAAHENRFSLFQKITTLGDDIIKKLALTTTITVINALQTNSWFGQLLKMVLNASGVKYSLNQNGYICLGSFFGNLIIQWGLLSPNPQTGTLQFNIAFQQQAYIGFLNERTPPTFNWAEFNNSTATRTSVKYSYVNINGIDTDLTNGTQVYDWIWIGR